MDSIVVCDRREGDVFSVRFCVFVCSLLLFYHVVCWMLQFVKVNEAYNVLSDAKKRHIYDK